MPRKPPSEPKDVTRWKDFTDRWMKSAAAKEKAVTKDEKGSGLQMRVRTQGGPQTWSVLYRLHGRQIRENLGTYPDIGVAAARDKARDRRELAREGIDPRGEVKQREASSTVAEFLDEYEAVKRRKGLRSISERMRVLRRELKPLGRRKLANVSKREFIELLDRVEDRGPGLVRVFQGHLNDLLTVAAERDVIERNPIAEVRNRGEYIPRDRVLEDNEIAAFWRGVDTMDMSPGTRRALKMILITGQRPEEVAAMQWGEINNGIWQIPASRRKTSAMHEVPLPSLALEILAQGPQEGYCFPSVKRDTYVLRSSLGRALKRVVEAQGVPRYTPHDLRRTCRTRLSAIGVKPHIAELVIGHAVRGMTAVYDIWGYRDEKGEALERWSTELRRIVGIETAENVVAMRRG